MQRDNDVVGQMDTYGYILFKNDKSCIVHEIRASHLAEATIKCEVSGKNTTFVLDIQNSSWKVWT